MIKDLMLYGTAIAALFALAGFALERLAARMGVARRGAWFATLLLSVALPTIRVLAPHSAPQSSNYLARSSPRAEKPSNVLTPAVLVVSAETATHSIRQAPSLPHVAWPTQVTLERILRSLWLTASLGLIGLYALLRLKLWSAGQRWRRVQLKGREVWITEALGPTVYGFIRPIILMPQWVIDGPEADQTLVLAHEEEHIAARDPGLLLLGLLLVVISPWNLPLWWQLRRLRFAMEVDCDARVLARGAEARAYGHVLLSIGQRRSFTPVGAIALTEPTSQLLRRIRIMTSPIRKRGKWLVVAPLGLALACIATAAQLQAPSLHPATSMTGEAATEALRKPPLGEDPRIAHVRNLVRGTYPELFNAAATPGAVLVTLLMNKDGTLFKSYKEEIEPRPWIDFSIKAFDEMGVDYQQRGDWVRDRMAGWPAATNHIDVSAWYLKPPADPTRDVAMVRHAVEARYASLFRPQYADGASTIREGSSVLTVFMTEAGDIDHAKVEVSEDKSRDAVVDLTTLTTPERFVAMGIARERIGPIGTTELLIGHFNDDHDLKSLRVIYAWPRRPNEPAAQPAPLEQPAAAGANDDPTVNRAIAEHYFPDLYTYPKEWPRADPWVLLDRQGKVLATGRRVVMSGRDVQLNIESLYPGIRTDGFQVTTVHGDHGQWADVGFVWLAADSPVTDPSKADLAHRNVLLLYADVIGEGMTRPTEIMTLKAGSPAFTVCSLTNPFGVVHVQVTPIEIGPDSVTLRLRVQHASLPATAAIPDALETAWSPESAPVRVTYGRSADVQVTDRDGKVWKIVLHPDRLGPLQS